MFTKKKTSSLTRLLIMRFSAMGDVATTIPVIHSLATQHSELRVTVLTRERFTPMYEWMPSNVRVIGIDLNDYKGINGLYRLYSKISSECSYDAVADLHNVLRTKFLRTCFQMSGVKVAVINKGRKEKHELIGHGTDAEALKPMTERYADVFRSLLGIDFKVSYDGREAVNKQYLAQQTMVDIRRFTGVKRNGEKWIGIAPFAAHKQKIYPIESMRLTAELLLEKGYKVFLFGAGSEETAELHSWECDGMKSCCGKLKGLRDELLLMTQLDLMICMDSANMHMAAMVGTQTLSVWGATHPKAGFMAYGQGENNVIQTEMACRPCSIYGNKPCHRGDMLCMTAIQPSDIVERAVTLLTNNAGL